MATRQLNPSTSRFPGLSGVPVFTYHGVTESEVIDAPSRERKYWVRLGAFNQQMNEIRRLEYRVRLLDDLWSIPEPHDLSDRSVVLTFDDGLASAYEVIFPILRQKGFRANFFLNTATVGMNGFLTWRQIKEMQGAGMSFQSHSHEHVYLSWLPDDQLARQLDISKRTIEDHLGCAVDFLSCPFGDLNARVIQGALKAGYTAVCTSMDWPATPGARTVNRVVVYCSTTRGEFQSLITGGASAYGRRAGAWAIKYFFKRLLGRAWPGPAPVGKTSLETKDGASSAASASFRVN